MTLSFCTYDLCMSCFNEVLEANYGLLVEYLTIDILHDLFILQIVGLISVCKCAALVYAQP